MFDAHFATVEALIHNAHFKPLMSPEKYLLLKGYEPKEQTSAQRLAQWKQYQAMHESSQRK